MLGLFSGPTFVPQKSGTAWRQAPRLRRRPRKCWPDHWLQPWRGPLLSHRLHLGQQQRTRRRRRQPGRPERFRSSDKDGADSGTRSHQVYDIATDTPKGRFTDRDTVAQIMRLYLSAPRLSDLAGPRLLSNTTKSVQVPVHRHRQEVHRSTVTPWFVQHPLNPNCLTASLTESVGAPSHVLLLEGAFLPLRPSR